MKLCPASTKASTIRRDSASSVPHSVFPNVIVPRQARDTFRPDRPKVTKVMVGILDRAALAFPKRSAVVQRRPHDLGLDAAIGVQFEQACSDGGGGPVVVGQGMVVR